MVLEGQVDTGTRLDISELQNVWKGGHTLLGSEPDWLAQSPSGRVKVVCRII